MAGPQREGYENEIFPYAEKRELQESEHGSDW